MLYQPGNATTAAARGSDRYHMGQHVHLVLTFMLENLLVRDTSLSTIHDVEEMHKC